MQYFLALAIGAFTLSACTTDPEDAFSTTPVGPEIDIHADILMTANTMDEGVSFTWKEARFLGDEVTYTFYAKYEGASVELASTDKLFYTATKTAFKTALYSKFPVLPLNDSFPMVFYVVADNGNGTYPSEEISVNIYAFGDAVVPVIAEDTPKTQVFDPANLAEELTLFSWSAARLSYNEEVTYNVYGKYGEGEPVLIAEALTALSVTKTVDEWNDLVVAAGAPEATASDVIFYVTAVSESIPEGVPSARMTINITTYTASYPAKIYIPGNYQGWNPADETSTIVASTLTKGLFESFYDLTTTDAMAQFKFAPDPSWDNAYSSTDYTVETDGDGNTVVAGKLLQGPSLGNLEVPAGLYRVSVNLKLKTFEMVKIVSMGVIGNATPAGWDAETPLVYDAAKNEYAVTLNMINGNEYKFRANNNWTWSIGKENLFSRGGSNIVFEKATGEYKLVLSVGQHPYAVKFLSTSFPEQLYIPGSHQGWSPASAPTLKGNGEGLFEGGLNLVDKDGGANCEWKFSPIPDWGQDFGGVLTLDPTTGIYSGTYGASANITTPGGYYYVKVDMTAATVEAMPVTKVGLIGDFNNWGGDAEFVYNTETQLWTLSGLALTATQGFKVRFNGAWVVNRGADAASEPHLMPDATSVAVAHNGKNMTVAADGTYDLVLNLSVYPNTLTVTKK